MSDMNESDPVVVWSGNIWEAGILKSLIEDEDIPVFMKDEIIGTLAPWWTAPGGAGSISLVVSKRDEERVRSIIKEFEHRRNS